MSRSTRSNPAPAMPPPPQDVVMGPPPLPSQLAVTQSQASSTQRSSAKDPSQEVAEKYRRLKRKFFELEEKHKDTVIQLRSAGDRSVRWRAEKSALLERIHELETNTISNPNTVVPSPIFTAYPRSLMSTRNQKAFITNLDQGITEAEQESYDVDPIHMSRHVGPLARKRQEAELREKQEEEAREARRNARRPRATQKSKEAHRGSPLTYAPAVPPGGGHSHGSSSASVPIPGTRLRLKGPAPPSADTAGGGGGSGHHAQAQERSESPLSPNMSPQEDLEPAGGGDVPMTGLMTLSPSSQYRQTPLDPVKAAQSQMQMTLRPSNSGSSRPSEVQRHAKPKRLKAHTVTTKSFSIPMVPRDKSGNPSLPLNVGIMTVLDLGEICMREHFHTERYIFPVGYEVTRRYLSTRDPHAEVVYHCKILDGGDGPKFQIIPADAPDAPVVAGTATGAWSAIVRAANNIRHRQHSNSVSGPDFFGLGQNTIKHLIQQLNGANKLKDYVWQNFQEGGPLGGRHAAVIPALPDEHETAGAVNPTMYYSDRGELVDLERPPRELQIIHVEKEDIHNPGVTTRVTRSNSSSGPPANMTSTIKPITFHQEYPPPPEREREPVTRGRGRKDSRASNHSQHYDEYANGGGPGGMEMVMSPPQSHPRAHQHQTHSHSPTRSHRGASRSPVMHREQVAQQHQIFSPQHQQLPPPPSRSTSHSHSPYASHAQAPAPSAAAMNGREPSKKGSYSGSGGPGSPQGGGPGAVPATFASIMHAYPVQAPPPGAHVHAQSPKESPEFVYANGR